MKADFSWLESHIAGAPVALADRVRTFLLESPEEVPADRLAGAGLAALGAAESRGSDRATALDLLAADALITLALLEVAERSPGRLATEAARLRERAAAA